MLAYFQIWQKLCAKFMPFACAAIITAELVPHDSIRADNTQPESVVACKPENITDEHSRFKKKDDVYLTCFSDAEIDSRLLSEKGLCYGAIRAFKKYVRDELNYEYNGWRLGFAGAKTERDYGLSMRTIQYLGLQNEEESEILKKTIATRSYSMDIPYKNYTKAYLQAQFVPEFENIECENRGAVAAIHSQSPLLPLLFQLKQFVHECDDSEDDPWTGNL